MRWKSVASRRSAGHRPASAGVEQDGLHERVRASIRILIRWPFHPFLLAATSVMSLYAANLSETVFSDAAPTLVVVLGAVLVLYLATGAALRGLGARAAIVTSIVVVLSLHYADLFLWLNRRLGGGYPMVVVLPVALLILAATIFAVVRTRASLAAPQRILNGVALGVFLVPATQAAVYEWRNAGTAPPGPDTAFQTGIAAVGRTISVRHRPDIYYFVFDRYASRRTLAKYYGFDDRELVRFLKESGFYVATESTANYFKTAYSLASTFHMDYINFLAEDKQVTPDSWRPVHAMLTDHRVGRFLKKQGYQFIQLGSWWKGTQHNPWADENYSFGLGEFVMIYARQTVLRPLLHVVLPDSVLTQRLGWDGGQCQRVPRKVERIKRLAERPQATFVFAHFLVPHDPHVFDPDGRCLSEEEVRQRGDRRGYIEQVEFTGNLIRDLVASLLRHQGRKPVIIIQADEGPFPERLDGSWREADDDAIQIKTSILNAYYFPDKDYSDLYRDITPINSFRILFNKLFDTRLEPLPDKVFGSDDVSDVYDFFEVTDAVRGRPDRIVPDQPALIER